MRFVTIDGPIAKIAVEGSFDVCMAYAMRDEVKNASMKGCTQIEVDLKLSTYIDSATINEFIKLRRKVKPENFWVINPNETLYKILKANRLTDWIKTEK